MASGEQGVVVDALAPGQLAGGRFMYCLPNFQNPTGRRLPGERRTALVAKAAEAGVPIVEDDPYGELYYAGEPLPSLLSMNPDGVVYMGSFSKVLAPGLRLGYVVAPEAVLGKLVQAKQAADLHTPSFSQRIVHEVVRDGFLDQHIPTIRALYGRRQHRAAGAGDRTQRRVRAGRAVLRGRSPAQYAAAFVRDRAGRAHRGRRARAGRAAARSAGRARGAGGIARRPVPWGPGRPGSMDAVDGLWSAAATASLRR
jgi:hypothetical protein